MATVLLVLHLMIAAGLIGVVLLQRSEGGGLGMGSSGGGGFMTGRGTANLLTRLTAGLAALFFATSISLILLAKQNSKAVSPLDLPNLPSLPKSGGPTPPTPEKTGTPDKTGGAATPGAADKGAALPAAPGPASPGATPAAQANPAAPATPGAAPAPADSAKAPPPPKSQ